MNHSTRLHGVSLIPEQVSAPETTEACDNLRARVERISDDLRSVVAELHGAFDRLDGPSVEADPICDGCRPVGLASLIDDAARLSDAALRMARTLTARM